MAKVQVVTHMEIKRNNRKTVISDRLIGEIKQIARIALVLEANLKDKNHQIKEGLINKKKFNLRPHLCKKAWIPLSILINSLININKY